MTRLLANVWRKTACMILDRVELEVQRDCEQGIGEMRRIKLLFCSTSIGMMFVHNEASLAKSIARPVRNMMSNDIAMGTEAAERSV